MQSNVLGITVLFCHSITLPPPVDAVQYQLRNYADQAFRQEASCSFSPVYLTLLVS